MGVRKSPRLLKNPTFSSSSTGRVGEGEVQEEEESSNHSQQINKLIPTYFTPPKLKPNSSTTATVEKSQAEESEKPKKKEDNAGAGAAKDPRRVWTDADEILLLKDMAGYVKRGENPNAAAFYESIQTKISGDVNFEQIRNKIKKGRQRYEAKEKEKKKGKVLMFTTPHLQKCHELSKPIWGSGGEPKDGGGGVEGSEAVGVENEDDLEIPKSKRDKKRKAAESKKPGKENGERKDGAAEEPEEEDVDVNAVTEKQKEVEAENVHVIAVAEKQKEVEGGEAKERNKKRKTEENVQVHADGEKQKEVVEAGETKEKKKNKKKKKKKTGAGDAECVSETLIMEQLAKAACGFEGIVNEEAKKAIQSIEPSKVVALEEKWKKLQVKEMQVLLKKAALVREFASMISEASARSTT